MPKIGKLNPQTQRLTLGKLKVLRALAGGAMLTSAKIVAATGTTFDYNGSTGLIEPVDIELDGGGIERCWRITKEGVAALREADGEVKVVRNGKKEKPLKVGTLVPWAGGNRMAAEEVGSALKGCSFVCVPFGGGLPELPHIGASTLVVNDRHRHVINLARVAADPVFGPMLYRRLRRKIFHLEVLASAQAAAGHWEASSGVADGVSVDAAEAYFISQWMGRSGKAGGDGELRGSLSLRWNANGGDSALRYFNAVGGLRAWRSILRRCSFCCDDWRPVVAKVKDVKGNAVYADPPWPGLGDAMYAHRFSEADHRDLARVLGGFSRARIVLRYLECPLAVELYAEENGWHWRRFANRNQGNNEVAEVLLIKNG